MKGATLVASFINYYFKNTGNLRAFLQTNLKFMKSSKIKDIGKL